MDPPRAARRAQLPRRQGRQADLRALQPGPDARPQLRAVLDHQERHRARRRRARRRGPHAAGREDRAGARQGAARPRAGLRRQAGDRAAPRAVDVDRAALQLQADRRPDLLRRARPPQARRRDHAREAARPGLRLHRRESDPRRGHARRRRRHAAAGVRRAEAVPAARHEALRLGARRRARPGLLRLGLAAARGRPGQGRHADALRRALAGPADRLAGLDAHHDRARVGAVLRPVLVDQRHRADRARGPRDGLQGPVRRRPAGAQRGRRDDRHAADRGRPARVEERARRAPHGARVRAARARQPGACRADRRAQARPAGRARARRAHAGPAGRAGRSDRHAQAQNPTAAAP